MADAVLNSNVALYLELVNAPGTDGFQIIITPPGESTAGDRVPSIITHRRHTLTSQRAQWQKETATRIKAAPVEAAVSTEVALEEADLIIASHMDILKQFSARGFKIRKEPIYIEINALDFDTLRDAKTPYDIIARIDRARKVQGFPAAIVSKGV